jgi:hypothetical protein
MTSSVGPALSIRSGPRVICLVAFALFVARVVHWGAILSRPRRVLGHFRRCVAGGQRGGAETPEETR